MNFFTFFKQHKLNFSFAIIAIALVTLIIASRIKNQAQIQTPAETPTVSLISVSDYLAQRTISLDSGIVQSLGQADLKSQLSGQIEQVNVKLGNNVASGQVLVQLQNRDIAAQLAQAQANLEGLKKGSRPEDIALSKTTADEAQTALINSIKDSYAKSDDAIHNHIDKFFVNPRQSNAEFLITANVGGNTAAFQAQDFDLANQISGQKYQLEPMLTGWQNILKNILPGSDISVIENAAALSKENLQKEIDFLNAMAPLVNNLFTDNATYKQIIDGYKTEFSAARNAISGALNSLQASQTALKTAAEALNLKLAGATNEQIQQAQASVDAIKATLAKTAIAAPINGKVSYIDANIGELATPGQLIATVVNPNALQVKSYASEADLASIAIGNQVAIDGNATGIVKNISPAVDPQTKKAEIIVMVTKNGSPSIIIGQSVSLKIISKTLGANTMYLLPIAAVQFSGAQNSVLVVNQNNIIEQIPVTTGELIGENVQITNGLMPNMKILSSVRGFKSGDKVNIQ